MELGILLPPLPGRAGRLARMAEDLGYQRAVFPDSQNLAPEVWGQLMLAAGATSTLQLGPGVTNSITRDPAVTASAALALQIESNGRAFCAIGRGDSSVQRIGREPDRVGRFERYLAQLRAYLHGETVDRDGFESRLEWRPKDVTPPPIEVAATGRRVTEAAARHADVILLAVGADPEHVARSMEAARKAVSAAGREGKVRYGAFVNCVVHDEVEVARDVVRGPAATFARFSSFAGMDVGALPRPLRDAARHLREHYDMRVHTRTAPHARALEDSFIDWFAVLGPPDAVVPRFQRLDQVGLDLVIVVPGAADAVRGVSAQSIQRFGAEVLPALR